MPDNLSQYRRVEVEQAYLCTSPTVRVRRIGEERILTVKEHLAAESSTAIHNREEEFRLSESAFRQLLSKAQEGRVQKTRYFIDLRSQTGDGLYVGLVAELDVFHGRHQGLELVEVEFPNTQAADAFVPPDWFGDDVSANPIYRNSFLAAMP